MGELIAGHYRVLDRIGVGGMGVVWRAMDLRLQRVVAVKQLLVQPKLSPRASDEARARALREARIAARLHHPNAIVVYDVAEHEGEPCLVMEYLPSRSLAAVLAERGCLAVPEVASIGRQIASALAAAHAAQIVHRDVKPGNILITDDGTAKITDFGVSRAAGDVTVTQTGMMAGTPAYLAPEVARGQVPTPASDVFSLGATLYASVEGRGPFGDTDNPLALLHAVAGGQVRPPWQAGALSAVLMRLLATDPAQRPGMHRASQELGAVRTTRPASSSGTARRPTRMTTTECVDPTPTVASAPLFDSPPQAASLPPGRPAYSSPPGRRQRRLRVGLLTGAVLAVLVFTGIEALLSGGSAGQQGAHAAGQAAAPAAPQISVLPSPPQVQRVDHVQPIGWSDAGRLVINYYNGTNDVSTAWQLLSPTAQAAFGSESDFREYWSQYSSVSARNAFGVTDNSDGSVRVPVEVTYNNGTNAQVVKRALRVTRLNGRLLIDSDPR
ncbi:MAG: eukaryotic-like serine/threonine-protein kinase [Pseudonocardiales bacterium]|jgi:serine/threonine protein kinase|nr:eukaryotic-like serine/threonine-protein kinase [Pseudonocardiales bacterium]